MTVKTSKAAASVNSHVKPSFQAALRLRCPNCADSKLQKKGSWFEFQTGCPRCRYAYEREPGYFWGAAWMITYTFSGMCSLGLAAYLVWKLQHIDALYLGLGAASLMIPLAVLAHPYSRAFWLFGDLYFHPIEESDHVEYEQQLSRTQPIGH